MNNNAVPEDYQVQSIFSYSRKGFKRNKTGQADCSPRDEISTDVENFARGEVFMMDTMLSPDCCDGDTDREIANILHKKCPVISLAHQQLQKLRSTEVSVCNTRSLRNIQDLIELCKQVIKRQKSQYLMFSLASFGFMSGLILGSASCGSTMGHFDSPFLACIDSLFMSDNPGEAAELSIF